MHLEASTVDAQVSKTGRFEKRWILLVLVLLLAGLLPTAGALMAPYSAYDDLTWIATHPYLQPERNWFDMFRNWLYTQYIPLTLLSVRVQFELFGQDAAWTLRLVNAFLHGLSGVTLMFIFRKLGVQNALAFLLALAWTVHPVTCEVAAWITQRNTALATLFGFLAIYGYLSRYERLPLLALAFYLCALLSKLSALGVFPILIALELLGSTKRLQCQPCLRPWFQDQRWMRSLLRLLPFAIVSLLAAYAGSRMNEARMVELPGGHWYTALMTDTEIFARYLFNLLVPVKLSAFYGIEDLVSFRDRRLFVFGGLLLLSFTFSLWLAAHRRRALLGWLWFLGAMGPFANLLAITFLMQDRYLYMAMPGLLLVLAEVVQGLTMRAILGKPPAERIRAASKPTMIVLSAFALFAAVLGFERSFIFGLGPQRAYAFGERTLTQFIPFALFEQAVEREPRSSIARVQLGQLYANEAERLRRPGATFDARASLDYSWRTFEQLTAAIDPGVCPDEYRYFDPLRVRVLLAREAMQLGQLQRAEGALFYILPPHVPPEGELHGLTQREIDQGFRQMLWNGRRYRYKRQTCGQGHGVLAELYRQRFAAAETPLDEALKSLALARQHIAQALACDAQTLEVHRILVLSSIVPERIFDPALPAEQQAALRKKIVADWERMRPWLQAMGSLAIPFQGAHAAHYRDVAGLALAEDALHRLKAPELKLEEAEQLLNEALRNVEVSAALTEKYPQIYLLQARIRIALDRLARHKNDLPAAWTHFEATVKLLGQIPFESPAYTLGQEMLSTLQPPEER